MKLYAQISYAKMVSYLFKKLHENKIKRFKKTEEMPENK